MNISTGDIVRVDIDTLSSDGSGIARNEEGFVLFVPFALPGENVEAKVVSLKKNYGVASLISIHQESPMRVAPPCKWFGRCGGCQLQHCSYHHQLKFKAMFVREALERIAHISPENEIEECVPSPLVWSYRNKASFPVRKNGSDTMIGFFKKGTHEIVPVDECMVNDGVMGQLFSDITHDLYLLDLHGYSEKTHAGMVRHIIIRKGFRTSELLLVIVLKKPPNRLQMKRLRKFAHGLKTKYPDLVGVTCNINGKRGNVILGEKSLTLQGRGWLREKLSGFSFQYDSTAFFQVNTLQAEKMFDYVCEEVVVEHPSSILELYSGVGVLTSFLAGKVSSLTAVEDWESSIVSMNSNFELNSISNVKIINGKVEDVTDQLQRNPYDVVVLDPPRSGCAVQVINFLKHAGPSRIVYVSCNPATLARDISLLFSTGEYVLEKVKPFDMFPHTTHVETVATLKRSSCSIPDNENFCL